MASDPETTVSSFTTKTARGTHAFEIIVRSGTFTVGGYDWAIRFYPDDYEGFTTWGSKVCVAIDLELMSVNAKVRALYDLRLVNKASGSKEVIYSATAPMVFSAPTTCWTAPVLVERSKIENGSDGFIHDDCLTIECNLSVVIDKQVRKTKGGGEIRVPPSNLGKHFSKLWLDEATGDVVFIVEGEAFPAHKVVLAARSPVFKAEFHGQMKERTERCITVEDMKPDVFKALLYFAYTDMVPESEWDDLNDGEYREIVRHLLVAADRYAMDRLKLMCAEILQDVLSVENVATTLALADQNNCPSLRDVCIEFMASTDKMDSVVATQGYADLKRNRPSILVDVLERSSKKRKT
ncbi:hypothetical protein EJB05_09067, partial [Eragrostis curvula]